MSLADSLDELAAEFGAGSTGNLKGTLDTYTQLPVPSLEGNVRDVGPATVPPGAASILGSATGVGELTGSAFQDESVPGTSIAAAEITTEHFTSTTTIALVANGTDTVVIDESGIFIYNGVLYLEDAYGVGVLSATGFDNAWEDFITMGFYNADFGVGPAAGADTVIDNSTNPLPYWTTGTVSGSPVFTWVTDSASPSGYDVAITLPGTLNEEGYIQQIVAIATDNSGLGAILPRATFVSDGLATGEVEMRLSVQFLKGDRVTTTGSSTTVVAYMAAAAGGSVISGVINDFSSVLPSTPSDAAFARIRFGVKRKANAGASDTVYLTNTAIDVAASYYTLADQSGSHNPGSIVQDDYGITLRAAGSDIYRLSLGYTGALTLPGALLPKEVFYADLTGDVDNWAPTMAGAGGRTLRLYETIYLVCDISGGAGWNVTGFSNTGFTDGQRFLLVAANGAVYLNVDNVSSSSGNRISSNSGLDVTVNQGCAVEIVYDSYANPSSPFMIVGA